MAESYIKIDKLFDILEEDNIYSISSIASEMILKHSLQNNVVLFYKGKKQITLESQYDFEVLEIDSSRETLREMKDEYEKTCSSRVDNNTTALAEENAFSAIGRLRSSLPPTKQKQLICLMIFSGLSVFEKTYSTNNFYKSSPLVADGRNHRFCGNFESSYIEIGALKSYLRVAKYPLPASIYKDDPDNTSAIYKKIHVNHAESSCSLDEISEIVCDLISHVTPKNTKQPDRYVIRAAGNKISISFDSEYLEPQNDLGFKYIYHILKSYPESIHCHDLIQLVSVKKKDFYSKIQEDFSLDDGFTSLDAFRQVVGDEKSIGAIKNMIQKLHVQYEEAQRNNTEEAFTINKNIKILNTFLDEYKSGNRKKAFETINDKNRKSVFNAIKNATKKLDPSKHKKMKSYFSKNIKTGIYCKLAPPEPHIPWTFE